MSLFHTTVKQTIDNISSLCFHYQYTSASNYKFLEYFISATESDSVSRYQELYDILQYVPRDDSKNQLYTYWNKYMRTMDNGTWKIKHAT